MNGGQSQPIFASCQNRGTGQKFGVSSYVLVYFQHYNHNSNVTKRLHEGYLATEPVLSLHVAR